MKQPRGATKRTVAPTEPAVVHADNLAMLAGTTMPRKPLAAQTGTTSKATAMDSAPVTEMMAYTRSNKVEVWVPEHV
jgi:hypothetical protein